MSTHAAMLRALERRSPRPDKVGQGLPAKNLALFTRQWCALIHAGIPLVQAFELLAQSPTGSAHTQRNLVRILRQLQMDVSAGSSLLEAFQKHPQTFNALYCSLLHAGESAGILDKLLSRLADTLEANQLLKSKIKNALMYPACILAVACTVVLVIMVWVVPLFEEVFHSMGASLPLPTQYLVNGSRWLAHWGLALLLLLTGALVTLIQLHRRLPRLQIRWEAFMCALPVVGGLLQNSRTAKWALTLSSMLEAGIPISEALQPAAAASGSLQLQVASTSLMRAIQEGSGLNQAMSKSTLFPKVLIQMCAIGEETGSLAKLLDKSAQLMVSDLNQQIAQLTTLLEPVIMVVLGAMIGGMLIALYLPIFNLGQVF